MNRSHKEEEAKKNTRGFLYEMSRLLAFFLFFVLVLLPMAPVFASEEDSAENSDYEELMEAEPENFVNEEEIQEEEGPIGVMTETKPWVVLEDEGQGDDISQTVALDDTNAETLVDEVNNIEDSNLIEDVGEPSLDETELILDIETSSTTVPTDSSVEGADHDVLGSATSTEGVIATSTEEVTDVPPDVLEVPELETPIATSTETFEEAVEQLEDVALSTTTLESTEEENTAVAVLYNDENKFIFSKEECVSVGDGSFYCSSGTTTPLVYGTDRVFSAVDSEGDREIYVERGGELTQISYNAFDEDGAYFDEISNSIVWHRLVNERYQIISYDVETGEETQLTNERYNNMEPSRYGDITVWQGWVGSDWEIMLEEDGELTMITDNTTNDVSPRINGNYIIWQSFDNGAWRVKVYDRITKQTSVIEDADGASVDNPRFVLVYDTKHENGDVETKGYDLESGEVMPFSAEPTSLPQEIPDPEQTGEERAMVQPPVQVKSKTESGIDSEPEPDPTDDTYATTTETGTVGDVIIPPLADSATSTDVLFEPEVDGSESTSTISDVVIPTVESLFEEDVAHIEDLIITPYVVPITDTMDSQETVASST